MYDGSLSFERGQDAGRPSTALPDNQVAFGYNATFRGGYPRHRPKLKNLDYSTTNVETDWWVQNKFQGASAYTDPDGKGHVFFSVGGRLYKLPIEDYIPAITEVSDLSLRNNPDLDQVWFCQAERYLLVQDGRSRPWVWDGIGLGRIPEGNNFPVGTRMAYGIGRIWVSQGSSYYGGDLVDSNPSLGVESILHFTENDYLNEGGAFHVPSNAGPITGLSFVAKQDTVSGEGSLMVFTKNSIFEFDAPVDRTIWASLEQPLQRFSLLRFGTTSQESIVPVNGDLFFRSLDGIRSFYFARREFNTWGNTPISRELGKSVSNDSQYWLKFCKGTQFDNRLLMTVGPDFTNNGVVWRKLVSLDFDLISSMGEKTPPAWEGEWEFLDAIFSIVTVDCTTGQRCIVILQDGTDGLAFYELVRDGQYANETITWGIDTKSYQYGVPLDKKRLQTFESWWDDQDAGGNIDVWWKPNGAGCWAPWGRYLAAAASCIDTFPEDCTPPVFTGPQAKPRVGLPIAPDLFDTTQCIPRRDGYSHQLKIRTTSTGTLKMIRVGSQIIEETNTPTFDDSCTALEESCETCT